MFPFVRRFSKSLLRICRLGYNRKPVKMSSDLTSIESQFNLNSSKAKYESIYEFGEFCLDAEKLMLYESGKPLSLAPKVVETLLVLIEKHGEIVSKHDLMNRLWANSFVEDGNLTQNIYLLRKTLGKNAEGQDLIETYRRRGYRFTGKLKAFDLPVISVKKRTASFAEIPVSRHFGWLTWLVLGLVLFVGVGLVLIYWRKPEKISGVPRPSKILLKRLTPDINIHFASISPDGKYLVYSQKQDEKESVWLKDIATGIAKQILPANSTEGYGGVYFSSDGKEIFYATTRKGIPNTIIMRIPFEGGTPQEIARNVISPLTVSPDGKYIAFVNGDRNLVVANADGSGERVLKMRDGKESWFESWGSQLSFSPDSQRIAICGGHIENGKRRVALTEISITDGSERDVPVPNWNYLDSVQWIPDSSGLMVIAKEESGSPFQIWRVAYPSGETTRVTQDLVDYKSMSIAADSRQMIATQQIGNLNIWTISLPDKSLKQITFGSAANDGFYGVEMMPDGRIVYTSPRNGSDDIWIMSPDGTNQKQLTANAGANINPSVSPDGRYIYFLSDRGNSVWRVWRVDADGSNPQKIADGEGTDDRPIVSPNGQWVYFARFTGNLSTIMKVPALGGESVRVTSQGNYGLLGISPDGKLLAVRRYNENAPVAWQTGLINAETGEAVRMFDERIYGRIGFSADGKSIIYTEAKNFRNLWQLALDNTEPQLLTNFESGNIRNFDISADGRTIALSHGSPSLEAVLVNGF